MEAVPKCYFTFSTWEQFLMVIRWCPSRWKSGHWWCGLLLVELWLEKAGAGPSDRFLSKSDDWDCRSLPSTTSTPQRMPWTPTATTLFASNSSSNTDVIFVFGNQKHWLASWTYHMDYCSSLYCEEYRGRHYFLWVTNPNDRSLVHSSMAIGNFFGLGVLKFSV